MSKQSEAKEKQGFSKVSPQCQNCEFFTLKKENVNSMWNSQVYIKETELRCSLGAFKVNKTTYCNLHKFKTE